MRRLLAFRYRLTPVCKDIAFAGTTVVPVSQIPPEWENLEVNARESTNKGRVPKARPAMENHNRLTIVASVVFAGFPDVTKALSTMHNELGQDGRLSPNIIALVRAMAAAAEILLQDLDDDFIERPFTPPVDTR